MVRDPKSDKDYSTKINKQMCVKTLVSVFTKKFVDTEKKLSP